FLRILRVLRFLKGFHYSRSLQRLTQIFSGKSEELLSSLIVMLSLLFVTSTLMYYAEHEAQPDKFGSIIESMWWAVATLTTVGYGDVTPITSLGRFLGAASAIIGIGLFAIPTGILAAGFAETDEQENSINTQKEDSPKVCSHCGQIIK
ncbi:MAG: ion transporter, partial [SAR324 cluster bacterium]|nr:ion transporter [SAR324 cluster bacterium]